MMGSVTLVLKEDGAGSMKNDSISWIKSGEAYTFSWGVFTVTATWNESKDAMDVVASYYDEDSFEVVVRTGTFTRA